MRGSRQQTRNGDASDIDICATGASALCLDDAPLTGKDAQAIAGTAGTNYGVLNRSVTNGDAAGALLQLVDRRPLAAGENEFVVGFSHDRSRNRLDATSELGVLEPDREVRGLGIVIAQADGSITPVALFARTRYSAVFALERAPLLPRVVVELGFRRNEARIALDDQLGTALNGSHRFTRLNPGGALDYTGPAFRLRAGYVETSHAPTPAELACADPSAPCSLVRWFATGSDGWRDAGLPLEEATPEPMR